MIRNANNGRLVALALTTALATATLSGCTTQAAPRADVSASKAQAALEHGQGGEAVAHAEAAVLAQPRNAGYRAMLGAAYMDAGRFQSAATSFQDAMSLGDNSPRTALSYALAETAVGNYPKASAVLDDWRDILDPADLGLALALAGQPDRGVEVLGNALRGGQNTAKVRQNLAYAYALQGNWRAARVMAAEDVPAHQLDARIGEWARSVQPEMFHARIAKLLDAPVVRDMGQPVALALSNNPGLEQLAAEASALEPVPAEEAPVELAQAAPSGELAAIAPAPQVATVVPAPQAPAPVQAAFVEPTPAPETASLASMSAQFIEKAIAFISNPIVQPVPVRSEVRSEPRRGGVQDGRASTQTERPVRVAAAPQADGGHLIQLGSFASHEGARRAWGIYAMEYDNLERYRMVITKARVNGKTYYRVSAGGFARADARSMCSSVKARGEGCIAWAAGRPLPGAIETGLRMARR